MKKVITLLSIAYSLCLTSQAAVSFSFKNYPGSPTGALGLPVVDSAGAAILNSTNSVFFSIGYLAAGTDNSAQGYRDRFVPLDASPLVPNLTVQFPATTGPFFPRNGLISGTDFSDAGTVLPANYVSAFQGKTVYGMFGNNANLSLSTAIAVFAFNTTFSAPNGVGSVGMSFSLTNSPTLTAGTAASGQANTALIGTIRSVTVQPVTEAGTASTFTQGIALQSILPIPETSTTLLGAIGALALLRRRRN